MAEDMTTVSEDGQVTVTEGVQTETGIEQATESSFTEHPTYEQMISDMEDILNEDALPEPEPEPEPEEGDDDGEEGEEEGELLDQAPGTDEGDDQEPELAADGLPAPKGEKANKRIQQLVERAKAAEAKQKEAEDALNEANQRAATTTPEHPDPDKELEKLKQRYASVKSPQQILQEQLINPLTGDVYTPAEAQAAVAEYKQDLQYQIQNVQAATVERMNQARQAEAIIATQLTPEIDKLLSKYPYLDPGTEEEPNPKADKDLCDMLHALVDSNAKVERGLLVGFKKPPKDFLGAFERMMINGKTVKVNQEAKINKKIDNVPSRGPLDNRGKSDKMSDEDAFMSAFDEAMKQYGATNS